ncbi:MAG: carboxypeptidase-like regulatory domain-containing protein [Desulfarculaceae bacterium]|nr:carboxypeptidase-like regulatory domain-containing protein [Desulfarculaceae bacterium]MCF8048813.1 carboxypeptidase-like regulatory domain-containing protein [Desulfarculaceae bacterium]MCF8064531.1 carboxypeptidase-like regulatory domain-containing protein [Desulfarculaceae bacterium]MCF8098164.1 carboxypeptidase-like regulatory domain-containing protein [Desulfarculaceae bacterium]MCF8121960.1 carboxypeptidase-like regulatory domain-containing protein [Desulfarculaceae bacterium]
MSRPWLLACFIMVMLLFAGSPAMAQSESGVISGVVLDRYGAPLKTVSVRASNLDDGLTVESITDNKGFFRMDKMSAGSYEVQVSLGPQGIHKRKVKLPKGQSVKVDFVFDVREPRAIDPTYRPTPPSLI